MTTDSEWKKWGIRDPYFAVLTNPQYRSAVLTPELKDEFFASGRFTVDMVLRKCRSYLDPSFAPERVLDFGCGVARMAIPFAAIAKDVVGMDVAETMLSEAERNCRERGCDNVTLVLSDDTLSQAPGLFDLVHSCLVLQHVEIARGRILFKALVEKIKPGGCGVIQLPFAWDVYAQTYGVAPPSEPRSQSKWSLNTILSQVLRRKPPPPQLPPGFESVDPEMRMNYYNLSELMFILERSGINHVVSDFTNHGGAIGAFMYFKRDHH